MLDNTPDLQVIDIYVALTKTPAEKRVAYGSITLGVGDRKILAKSFTVFRSPRTSGLYVTWPGYTSQSDGKTIYKDYDIWLDVEEAKYWVAKIIEEVNKLLGVTSSVKSKETPPVDSSPGPATNSGNNTPPAKRAGWKRKV